MFLKASVVVSGGFVILPLLVAAGFVLALERAGRRLGDGVTVRRRRAVRVGAGVLAWLLVTALTAAGGLLRRFDATPPPFAVLALAVVVVGIAVPCSSLGTLLVRGVPLGHILVWRSRARVVVRIARVVGALLLAASPPADAHSVAKVYRIGVLEGEGAAANAPNLDAFRRALQALGHVEGQTYVLEYRSADGRADRFPDLARELVRLEVDVIVTRGTPAALSSKQATRTIPIVMASSGDPAAEGIVANLARPGGNVTGFHVMAPVELGGKRLQLLKEAVPAASRVGILWNPVGIHAPLTVRDTEKAAPAMKVQLKGFEVQRPEALGHAFEAALMGQVDALIAVEDSLTFGERARIVDFAAMSRLPAIYGLREFVDVGGLMSYGTDRRDLFRRAAIYVDRILKGARPADLPVEAPTKFELAINLKTARTLGLTMSPSLVRRADHIVP